MFLCQVSFAKRTFKFRKVISWVYPITKDKFKNLVEIIQESVKIDKIASYGIMPWSTVLMIGKQFINLNSFLDVQCILSNFRQKCMHLFCLTCIFVFVFSLRLGYQPGQAWSKYIW